MTALTREEVHAVLGPVDDTVVAEIIATGATRGDLAEAQAWRISDEALMNVGRPLPSGRVGRLVEIMEAMDLDDEASAVPSW